MSLSLNYLKNKSKIFYDSDFYFYVPYPRFSQLLIKVEGENLNKLYSFYYFDKDQKRLIWRFLKVLTRLTLEMSKTEIDKKKVKVLYLQTQELWVSFNVEKSQYERNNSFLDFWRELKGKSQVKIYDVIMSSKTGVEDTKKFVVIPCEFKEN